VQGDVIPVTRRCVEGEDEMFKITKPQLLTAEQMYKKKS
jgi:predicted PP-loop superfamily ATPase